MKTDKHKEGMCQKKFLWFRWYSHEWVEYDIFQKSKTIGKVPDRYEVGIYKKVWKQGVKERCKKCKTRRSRIEKQWTETRRQYH